MHHPASASVPPLRHYGVIDLQFLLDELWRQRWVILRYALALALLTLLISLRPERPGVEATLRVDPGGGQGFMLSRLQNVDTEIGSIKSWTMIHEALKELDYYGMVTREPHPARMPAAQTDVSQHRFGLHIGALYFPASMQGRELAVVITGADLYELQTASGELISRGKTGQLLTGRAGRAGHDAAAQPYRLQITAIHARPGARFLIRPLNPEALTGQITEALDVSKRNSEPGSNLIDVGLKLDDPQLALRVVETVLARYLSQSQARQTSASQQALKTLGESLAELKTELEERKQALLDFFAQTQVIDPQTTARSLLEQQFALMEQRHKAATKLARQELVFTGEHPAIIALKREIALVEEQLAETEATLARLPAQQSRLQQLQRELELSAGLYQTAITELSRVQLEASRMPQTAEIVDRPRLVEPKRLPFIVQLFIFGGLLGGIIGLALTLLRASLTLSVVYSPKQLGRLTALPVMQAMLSLRRNQLVEADRKKLTSQLRFALHDPANRAIALYSPKTGTDQVYLVMEILAALGAQDSVLLIDADFYHAPLRDVLGDRSHPGLSDVLARQAEAAQAVQPIRQASRLAYMSAGTQMLTYDLLRRPDALAALLENLQPQFARILVWLPEPELLPDAPGLLNRFDHALHLVRHGTPVDTALSCLQRCEQADEVVQQVLLYDVVKPRRGFFARRIPTLERPSRRRAARSERSEHTERKALF